MGLVGLIVVEAGRAWYRVLWSPEATPSLDVPAQG